MIRIVFCVIGFIAATALGIHFWIGAAAGDGASMLWLAATAASFLAFVALVVRPWIWLRTLLLAGAFAAGALVVDQAAYCIWHERFDSFVAGLQYDVERGAPDLAGRMGLRPTSLRIEPGEALQFTFEPPLLAWTYHLDSSSPQGHRVVARWHRLLARAASGTPVDPVAEAIIAPHQAYSVSVASSGDLLACRDASDRQWTVSVQSAAGGRPL